MPALSWNEIRQRAIQFSRSWKGVQDERAEVQTFWNEFFEVFGIKRRMIASFEEPVKSLKKTYHFIDLFWKGHLLAEHKSAGESLEKAQSQAIQYIQELAASQREDEIPRYIILCDFNRMALYDLEPEEGDEERIEFPLSELHKHIRHFAFFIGQKTHKFGEEDEANLKAAEIMARLHDAVADSRYDTKATERLLVRLLFCLFADDTGIFDNGEFELYIENHTRVDGSDIGPQLNALFEVLDTPTDKRPKYLDEDLESFPYVNGELFKERLPTAGFNRAMRDQIVAACHFDWSRISPALFGSLFQGIMDDRERRQIGAHYTSERDILKVIRPLFLDDLESEFEQIQNDRSSRRENRLYAFQRKLASLKFLDPACGCGNFLVIAYRELRRLERKILAALFDFETETSIFSADEQAKLSQVDVNQFYGIEIGEWPSRIAETALWLTDHQMNTELSLATGNLFQRIPLRAAPHIRCANALRFDWNELLPASECSYILGNPPFVGYYLQNKEQKEDLDLIYNKSQGTGVLDYVTAWYVKAGEYIQGTRIKCGYVSTNSISQGEQPGILWEYLYNNFQLKIHFAHRTFQWVSEAKGKAHVYVVIIGFSNFDCANKRLFDYERPQSEPHEIRVHNINPYLVEGDDIIIQKRPHPICNVPVITKGSQPTDGGYLLLNDEERNQIVEKESNLEQFINPLLSAKEYLHAINRWCFWLKNTPPEIMRNSPELRSRLKNISDFRISSKKEVTRRLADSPALFAEDRQPNSKFILIPIHTSENRKYVPFGFFDPSFIVHNSCSYIQNATLYHLGVISSTMHMDWMRYTCGRLESRYRYSNSLVYNNFPWPLDATAEQKAKVEECAKNVLDVRQGYLDKGTTLADLYDSLTMPAPLLKAHQTLDAAVDRCYRSKPFKSERERVEYLFQLYEQITTPLAPSPRGKKIRRNKR